MIDQGLTPSLRRRLHQVIGERLEAGYAGRTQEVASALATHFERSRDVERAIRYHGEAAAHAGSRLAQKEIRLHLQAALDLLHSRPESQERLLGELPLLQALGWTLVTINGWGDQDAFGAFTRMRDLAARLEVPAMRLRAMESLRTMHAMRAEYAMARALCEETMALAKQLGDDRATGSSHVDLAAALVLLGEVERAHDHAERGRALVDPTSVHGIGARVLLAGMCTDFGLVARSKEMCDEALACAAKTGIPYLSALAATYAAGSALRLRDFERTRSLAEDTLRLASERGFSSLRINASMLLGWCGVEEGRVEEGRAALRAGFAELTASDERIGTTTWETILASAHLACGDVASANAVLDAAFAFAGETGERVVEHELHRLRASVCSWMSRPLTRQRAPANTSSGRSRLPPSGKRYSSSSAPRPARCEFAGARRASASRACSSASIR